MFIWEKKIKSAKNWLVEFEDGSKQLYSAEYLKYFTTKEAKPLDDFRIHKTHKLISDVMKLYVESNCTMDEIQTIMDWLWSSMENAKSEAVSKLLGVSHPWDINFKTINDVVLNK